MRVLIVDDNSTDRELLRAVIESHEGSLCEAGDGLEALAVLEREQVDAIISDVLMPRMDGYRLCLELRKNEKFKAIPFIFYTSSYAKASACLFLRAKTFAEQKRELPNDDSQV